MLSEEANFHARLARDWRDSARPLLIADEVRMAHPTLREIIAFVFVCTDTRTAASLADRASVVRSGMSGQTAAALIKGADLYGTRSRSHHDAFRAYVTHAIRSCTAIVRVATTSPTVTRYTTIAPGGIRRETEASAAALSPITGRELVPFMNMVKAAATALKFGDVQVDVLLDRSAQLGLDPSQLGMPQTDVAILGPSRLNVRKDGSDADFICSTSFRFISTSEKSAFRDLLLLPDSVGYAMRTQLHTLAPRLATTDFVIDVFANGEVEPGEAQSPV